MQHYIKTSDIQGYLVNSKNERTHLVDEYKQINGKLHFQVRGLASYGEFVVLSGRDNFWFNSEDEMLITLGYKVGKISYDYNIYPEDCVPLYEIEYCEAEGKELKIYWSV